MFQWCCRARDYSGGLAGGSTATLTVSGAAVGATVLIGYSLTGSSPTLTPFGSVDMIVPIMRMPVLVVNGSGEASVITGIPARASGFTIFTQAADLATGTMTNSLAEVVL